MIVSCVFRCIMHVYRDRVRKQILETIGLMTTFLICGAALPFYAPNHCLFEQYLHLRIYWRVYQILPLSLKDLQ